MKILIKNKQLNASINSTGAELFSLLKNNSHREYIWEGNPAYWGKHSPVLFPIVGALKENRYEYQGKFYSLTRHGFARDQEFQLIFKTETEAVFSLKTNAETTAVYPFDFELQISYRLIESQLIIAYKVINLSDILMPFSIGAHPAFSLPKTFSDYSLEFENQETLHRFCLAEDLLSDSIANIELHDKKLSLNYELFENDALVFKSMQSKKIAILENGHPILGFHYKDFPHFGIWTKQQAPFICLEPWLGYSDTVCHNGKILEKEAIQILAPRTAFHCQFEIEIY